MTSLRFASSLILGCLLLSALAARQATAAPAHNVCVPRAVGVPTREGPPKWLAWTGTSGAVEPVLDDPRWLGSTGHSFQLGSAKAPLQTRALWTVDGGKEYLHLSFIVDVDGYAAGTQSTSRDVFVGFRRATALPSELGYIFQFHLKGGNATGVVAPVHCAKFNECATGGTAPADYWRVFIDKGQTGSCTTTGHNGHKYERLTGATVNDPPLTWMTNAGTPDDDAVRYWKLAPSAATPFQNRWAVQLRLPIVDAGHPISEGIERGSTFWYQATAELPTQPGRPGGNYATVGWWPRELTTPICPMTSLADFLIHEELGSVDATNCPLCSPDKFSNLTTSGGVAAACDGGITIDSGSVGAVFNAAPGTDFTLATPTNQFKAVTPGGVAAPNTVIAQPRNTTGTDILAPLMARFRLAAWGSAPWSNPADTGRWKDMRGAEGGVCGAGTAPSCTPIRIPASGGGKAAITFQWQIGNDPALGPSEYCKYGLTPPAATGATCGPCTCGASCDAPGTGVQATGFPCVTPTYQYDQCMLVELSAPNGVANFASQSTWNNMTFSQMSVMSREALIDARDLPKAPGQRAQDIYLIAMPRNMPAKLAAPTDGGQLVRQQAFDRALAIAAPYAEDFDKLTPEQIKELADKLGHPIPGPNHDDVGHANPLAKRLGERLQRLLLVRVIMPQDDYERIGHLVEIATATGTAAELTERTVTTLGPSEAADVVPTLDIYPFYQPMGSGTVYMPMTSFTVFLSHENMLSGIRWLIDGATQVGENVFHLSIPIDHARRIQVRAQAVEPPEAVIGPNNPKWPCSGGCACGGSGARSCGLVSILGNTAPGLVAGVFAARRRRKPAKTKPAS